MANDTPAIDFESAQRLAAAVLTGAVADALGGQPDALGGQPDAIYWLHSSQAAYFANLEGFDETGLLVTVGKRCQPERRIVRGRLNEKHFTQALSL